MHFNTYSPKMTIKAVDSKTASHPPPKIESRTMGSVSLTITFDSSRVTSTQYLPLFNRPNTRLAFSFSDSEPDCTMTWRFVSSRPISPNVSPAQICYVMNGVSTTYALTSKETAHHDKNAHRNYTHYVLLCCRCCRFCMTFSMNCNRGTSRK